MQAELFRRILQNKSKCDDFQDVNLGASKCQDAGHANLGASRGKKPCLEKTKNHTSKPKPRKKKKRNAGDANLRALRGCRGRKSYLLCCVYTRAYGAIYECVVGLSGAIPSEGLQFFFFFCLVVTTIFLVTLRCISHQQTYCPLVLTRVAPQYVLCFIVYTLQMQRKS